MEYLIREGFREAAIEFQKETGISADIDQAVIDSQIDIRQSVEKGDIQKAIETTNDLDSSILDTNPELFFHLQLQQLLEYIREGNVEQALIFAQNELSARGEENSKFLDEIESSLALLAYEDPSTSPFHGLLQHSQRLKVVSELNSAILNNQGEEESSRLSVLMKLVLWAQNQLDKKNITYPKLTDITSGQISYPESS
jgi:hypothetical protein